MRLARLTQSCNELPAGKRARQGDAAEDAEAKEQRDRRGWLYGVDIVFEVYPPSENRQGTLRLPVT